MFDLLFGNKAVLVPAIIVIAVLIICILGYIKAPPDMAYIISGLRKKPKILIGRAGVRIPFLERVDKLMSVRFPWTSNPMATSPHWTLSVLTWMLSPRSVSGLMMRASSWLCGTS